MRIMKKIVFVAVMCVAATGFAGAKGWNFAAKFPEGGHPLRALWTVKHLRGSW